jgi:catechol 2,3-dioxygenase-like lactoylglutathione lyase family enzyme
MNESQEQPMPQPTPVQIACLDHINIQTPVVEETCAFFEGIVGLKRGFRPDFPFPGAWLYLGEKAVVHVIGMSGDKAGAVGSGRLNHVGFMASGYATLLDRVRKAGIAHEVRDVPGVGQRQVFMKDPNGVSVELAFDAAETTDGPAGVYQP